MNNALISHIVEKLQQILTAATGDSPDQTVREFFIGRTALTDQKRDAFLVKYFYDPNGLFGRAPESKRAFLDALIAFVKEKTAGDRAWQAQWLFLPDEDGKFHREVLPEFYRFAFGLCEDVTGVHYEGIARHDGTFDAISFEELAAIRVGKSQTSAEWVGGAGDTSGAGGTFVALNMSREPFAAATREKNIDELLFDAVRGEFRAAGFEFDGTLSGNVLSGSVRENRTDLELSVTVDLAAAQPMFRIGRVSDPSKTTVVPFSEIALLKDAVRGVSPRAETEMELSKPLLAEGIVPQGAEGEISVKPPALGAKITTEISGGEMIARGKSHAPYVPLIQAKKAAWYGQKRFVEQGGVGEEAHMALPKSRLPLMPSVVLKPSGGGGAEAKFAPSPQPRASFGQPQSAAPEARKAAASRGGGIKKKALIAAAVTGTAAAGLGGFSLLGFIS